MVRVGLFPPGSLLDSAGMLRRCNEISWAPEEKDVRFGRWRIDTRRKADAA